ncbi:uncharacterized protein LOC144098256 isoform X2 [Amblyomma americanum]
MPLQLEETAGLRGTKGNEVIQSLARLLEKVHRLEVHKRAAKLGEHIALVEAQCALLGEQLRYARRVLAFSTNLRSTPDVSPDAALPKSWTYDNDEVFVDSNDKERASRDTTPKVLEAPALAKPPNRTRRARSMPAVQHAPALSSQLHQQCRLTVADVPFIPTKSATTSHSLPANLQNLVSLLKKVRPQCSRAAGEQRAAGTAHRQLCVVGSMGLPRSSSDPDLASQPDGLLHLMLQGEQLLKQLSQTQVPGMRHSLKCQCRRLISRIQAKLAETGGAGAVPVAQKRSTRKQRSASTSSHGRDPFNRVIMRELRRIQDHLEERI